jgi:hypothetical protein
MEMMDICRVETLKHRITPNTTTTPEMLKCILAKIQCHTARCAHIKI